MVPERNFFYQLEPKKNNGSQRRLSWYGKVFKMVWDSEPAQSGKRLKITINQGVSGMAYRDKKLYAKDLTQPPIPEYNFTKYQHCKTEDLFFVISCPIFKGDVYYSGQLTDNVIGVLNVESDTDGANRIFGDRGSFQVLENEVISLSNVCSKIL